MLKTIRRLFVTIILLALLSMAYPWLEKAMYTARLLRMPVPATLPMPVDMQNTRTLRDTWQAARSDNRVHEGIDIFAKRGTPVMSTTEGIVQSCGENRLGGFVVWVLGPGGQRHYYAHLDQFAGVCAGDRVQAGTVLGYVGNTGNARTTPPHLHYGVYTNEGAINPYPFLASKKQSTSPGPGSSTPDKAASRTSDK